MQLVEHGESWFTYSEVMSVFLGSDKKCCRTGSGAFRFTIRTVQGEDRSPPISAFKWADVAQCIYQSVEDGELVESVESASSRVFRDMRSVNIFKARALPRAT